MTNRALLPLTLALALAGCATSHDKHASAVQATARTGGLEAALAQHEASAKSADDKAALLYNLERGELLRLNRKYAESTEAYLQADVQVQKWEDTAKTSPDKLLGMVGAGLISESLKAYEGQDYEKVWLTTRLALNRLAQGDLEKARVDIKRTHEREAVIAELRAKETVAAEDAAKAKGATTQNKELNGYPVESLNDPEVQALKNGYSNALSHYLAGYFYEVLNESGLAAPGYRKAIELQPNTAVLDEGLRGLDNRTSFTHKRRQKMTDVLFIVEAGNAPARKPQAFTLPIPTTSGSIKTVSISYPVIEPSKDPFLGTLDAAGIQFKLERVVDVNVMARRALKDEMHGMVLRSVTRAIAKNAAQDALQKGGGMFGAIIGMAGSMLTETADDRIWRMLPGRVYVARGYLPPGEHQVQINGRALTTPIKVDGLYTVVPLRVYEDQVLMGQVSSLGQLAQVAPAPAPTPAPQAPAVAKPKPKPAAATPSNKAAPTPKPAVASAAPAATPAVAKPAAAAKPAVPAASAAK